MSALTIDGIEIPNHVLGEGDAAIVAHFEAEQARRAAGGAAPLPLSMSDSAEPDSADADEPHPDAA